MNKVKYFILPSFVILNILWFYFQISSTVDEPVNDRIFYIRDGSKNVEENNSSWNRNRFDISRKSIMCNEDENFKYSPIRDTCFRNLLKDKKLQKFARTNKNDFHNTIFKKSTTFKINNYKIEDKLNQHIEKDVNRHILRKRNREYSSYIFERRIHKFKFNDLFRQHVRRDMRTFLFENRRMDTLQLGTVHNRFDLARKSHHREKKYNLKTQENFKNSNNLQKISFQPLNTYETVVDYIRFCYTFLISEIGNLQKYVISIFTGIIIFDIISEITQNKSNTKKLKSNFINNILSTRNLIIQ